MNAAQYPELGYTKCENNFVEAIKGDRCDMFLPLTLSQLLGSSRGLLSWRSAKMAIGRLPAYSVPSIWREIRTYKSFVVVGSERVYHGRHRVGHAFPLHITNLYFPLRRPDVRSPQAIDHQSSKPKDFHSG